MPRLCIFFYDFAATGVVRNAIALARHMSEAGWDVTLVTVRGEGVMKADATGLQTVVLRPDMARKVPRWRDLLQAIPRLRRTLRKLDPDVALSAGNHAHLPFWLANRTLTRSAKVYRISNELSHGGERKSWAPRRLALQSILSDADKVVLVSPDLASDRLLQPAVAEGRTVVIENGIDPFAAKLRAGDCQYQLPWQAEGEPVVLAVGRANRQKNFETLIEACGIANHSTPLRLVIVGKMSASFRDMLKARAVACGLGDKLFLPGSTDNPFAAMKHASVVAVPSLWEGASNVLLEAMAVGVPIVASRTAGNASRVLDGGRYGALVDPRNGQAMADAILRQVDPVTRVLPGDGAARYDRRNSLEAYRAMFDSLLAEPELEYEVTSQVRMRAARNRAA